MGRKIDIVQHDEDRPAQNFCQLAEGSHDLYGMRDLKIIERLSQKNIFGILCRNHCRNSTLPLTTAKLIYVAIFDFFQIEKLDSLIDFLMIFRIETPL